MSITTKPTKADPDTAKLQESVAAVRKIADALYDAVKVSGDVGAPGGLLYHATMHILSMDQFQQFMNALVAAGKLRKDGHVYYAN